MAKSASKKNSSASKDLARDVAQAAFDLKAEDIIVLDIRKLHSFSDFFVIATGRSDRHVKSIADNIEGDLKGKKLLTLGIEGYQTGHWVLIDCGSVVAHVFYEEARVFYALEKLWGDAPRVKFRLK